MTLTLEGRTLSTDNLARPGEVIPGECLEVMQQRFHGESVDMIATDPPFNSGRRYDKKGRAFDDKFGSVDKYIAFMKPRVWVMKCLLKPTGSLYLHCDPHASHYLKILCDEIFGIGNFRNEIIWRRHNSHNNPKRWAAVHDVILYYARSPKAVWNPQHLPYKHGESFSGEDDHGVYDLAPLVGAGVTRGASSQPWGGFDPKTIGKHWAIPSYTLALAGVSKDRSKFFNSQEKLDLINEAGFVVFKGRGKPPYVKVYKEQKRGVSIPDVVDDIPALGAAAGEKYPTQKPIALYERFILASSNPGDLVLDPFCGGGTTLAAAARAGRDWIGIDASDDAVEFSRARVEEVTRQQRLGL